MEYFVMEDSNELNLKKPNIPSAKTFENKAYMEVLLTDSCDFPDIFHSKVWFVSEKFKKIIEAYDPDIFGGTLVLINHKSQKTNIYFQMNLYTKDCLSKDSKFNSDGFIEDLVLNRKEIGPFKIFKIKNKIQEFSVVSLYIVEKILRENIVGLRFKKIKVGLDNV